MERTRSTRRRAERKKSFGVRCRDICRKVTAFTFSNVGIIGLVLGYTIMGAYAFIFLESGARVEERRLPDVNKIRDETINRLWNITFNLNILYKENWTQLVETEVIEFQKLVIEAAVSGYDGHTHDTQNTWSFSGGFLYSLTVITTIGYGHIVPNTTWGKGCTIVYAIFGIPLFLLYLSTIGYILAKSFKWTYSKMCRCPRAKRRQFDRFKMAHALQDRDYPNPSNLPSVQLSEMTMASTSPLGNADLMELEEHPRTGRYSPKFAPPSDWESECTDRSDEVITVPITLCLTIMVGYILSGAVLFSNWEKDWTFLESSYFCFISLSTIGFGDFVPGQSIGDGSSEGTIELSFVFCSMYLMLGMAIIAMCFSLMQEEVIHKFRSLGKRCGIIRDGDEDEDMSDEDS